MLQTLMSDATPVSGRRHVRYKGEEGDGAMQLAKVLGSRYLGG